MKHKIKTSVCRTMHTDAARSRTVMRPLIIGALLSAWLFPLSDAIGQSAAPPDESSPPPSEPADEAPLVDDSAAVSDEDPENIYASLDIEQLMQIQVTSVAGVESGWFETPAALHVLTGEDIRRAGHQSIPEALRLVPGMHVARLESGTWAISARGFTSEFANKLQVLMDGRRVYDPLFSGVYWDVVDTVMEDLDRIEVVRGPGATLWGANAVNGVINITTKSAADTQGLLLSGGVGTYDQGFGTVRYGGKISEDAHFRVYGKYRNLDNMPSRDAGRRPDDWSMWQTGFRFDFGNSDSGKLTIQGDAFHMPKRGTRRLVADPSGHFLTQTQVGHDRATGGNFLTRLHYDIDEKSHWSLQLYYDRLERLSSNGFRYVRDSFDTDFRHHFHLGDHHAIVWGLNARHDSLESEPAPGLALVPPSRSANTFSAFIQDTITLVPDRLFAMLGTKLEHNDFTGFEVQPSARLWWTPNERQTIWAAVSRPVRTPSWIEEDLSFIFAYADPGLLMTPPFPTGTTIPLSITGNPDIESEEMLSWEAGYRQRFSDSLTVDIAGFYNRYEELITVPAFSFENVARSDVYGIEVSSMWDVADNWSLHGSYSLLHIHTSHTSSEAAWDGGSPRHQFQIHSWLDITDDLELNAGLYFVDKLEAQSVGRIYRMDVGLTWRPSSNVELSVWGQNLLDDKHVEFESAAFSLDSPAQVERSVTVQATLRF